MFFLAFRSCGITSVSVAGPKVSSKKIILGSNVCNNFGVEADVACCTFVGITCGRFSSTVVVTGSMGSLQTLSSFRQTGQTKRLKSTAPFFSLVAQARWTFRSHVVHWTQSFDSRLYAFFLEKRLEEILKASHHV